jgi:hypothetical protein
MPRLYQQLGDNRMPVSDHYVVKYLIQSTQERGNSLRWTESEAGEFRAELNGVRLSLFSAHATDGSRLCLKLSRSGQRTFIEEPRNVGFLEVKYRNEEEAQMAEALRVLAGLVASQVAVGRRENLDLRDSIRESLYNQLLFGN